jgi:uncharacterized glyoxalase superfamily protein PhnB
LIHTQTPDYTERRWSWWGRVIFYHSDVDALHASVVAGGYIPDTAPHDAEWGERFFHLTDPDGHAQFRLAATIM